MKFYGYVAVVVMCGTLSWGNTASIAESARAMPVCQEADVVVVGGSCGAVAAAQAAAKAGAKVFLAAPRPYLGDDVAGIETNGLSCGVSATADTVRAARFAAVLEFDVEPSFVTACVMLSTLASPITVTLLIAAMS